MPVTAKICKTSLLRPVVRLIVRSNCGDDCWMQGFPKDSKVIGITLSTFKDTFAQMIKSVLTYDVFLSTLFFKHLIPYESFGWTAHLKASFVLLLLLWNFHSDSFFFFYHSQLCGIAVFVYGS